VNELEKKHRRHILANRLKEMRVRKGLSQDQVAEAMDCVQSLISKYEAAEANVTLEIVIKLADVFGCTTDYLVGRDVVHDQETAQGMLLHNFQQLNPGEQMFFATMLKFTVENKK